MSDIIETMNLSSDAYQEDNIINGRLLIHELYGITRRNILAQKFRRAINSLRLLYRIDPVEFGKRFKFNYEENKNILIIKEDIVHKD